MCVLYYYYYCYYDYCYYDYCYYYYHYYYYIIYGCVKKNYVIARSQGTCLVVGGCVCSSLLKLGELRPSNGLNETFSPT